MSASLDPIVPLTELQAAPVVTFFETGENPATAAAILIVDSEDISRRLLRGILKASPYRMLEVRNASDAMALLQSEKIDLVILDLLLPGMSGPELCRWMKANRATQLIPILMMTSVQGVENEIVGISSGADEFLIKPLHPAVVRTRVRAMLRNKALIDSLEEAESILFALAQAVEHRDPNTGQHCHRLAVTSVMLGEALGLPKQDLTALFRGGYLHDIGKVGIPDAILFKSGPLTAEEWETMRSHPLRGEEICRAMKSLWPVLPIIRNHHEHWDGSGYPDGLAGEDIPLLARILQVADIFDALTTERPYKPALSPRAAIAVMEEEVRRGWRDPELVPLFATIIQSDSACDHAVEPSLENLRLELAR
ncbi:MAG TPA: HD domain-containing phosphohydrolase [Bryobacteraceae bacterium]|nr:HD domain-containing phosphohydrolase [Bryobacteraceae bacterium]